MAVDPNMSYAYEFAKGLAPSADLPASLQDVEFRAEFVATIDGPFVLEGTRWLTMGEIGERIAAIDQISRRYMPDVPNALARLGIALRLWAACISGAKHIANETLGGPNTPEVRRSVFEQLDALAADDVVYRAGLEAAPAFQRRRQQPYAFDGVPLTSPVRRYP